MVFFAVAAFNVLLVTGLFVTMRSDPISDQAVC